MAFIRFGDPSQGKATYVNTDNIIKMTQMRYRHPDTGNVVWKRTLWFNDGSTIDLLPDRAAHLDTILGADLDTSYSGA